uniref:IS66 family transposase n=1 Tax=Aquisphaera insulae TaxID=2712864 RepID=UPI00202EB273
RRNDELERILDATAADYSDLRRKNAELVEELALIRRYLFGRRCERVADDPGQGHLFDLPDAVIGPDPLEVHEPEGPAADEPAAKAPRSRSKPRTSFDHLPHVRVEHDLSEAEKSCPCCGGMKRRIGEDISRELEFIPAKFEIREHVLPKYACPKCKGGVAAPPVPPKPVPGGIAGAGLVSFVVVGKFADHLPLYRLEDILFRHGVTLSRSTLCDWVRNAADLLRPLADLQRRRVLATDLIWTDDTFVTALSEGKPGSTKARFWAYIGGVDAPYSVYDFTMSRERNGPATFLKEYRGYLQADAYGGYDGIYTGSDGTLVEVACWAHARRKFFEARANAPAEANRILEWVRQLYDIEDRGRDLMAEDRRALRQRESVSLLGKIEAYIDELAPRTLPKSSMGKALTYARNQRAALRRYVGDGRLTIDNNVSERTLRLQAIGRKNWLFLGSEAAGPRAAVLFTILAGAKRHRLEPWVYLREVILHLAADGEGADLEELLPDRWAAAHPEHVLEHRLEESRQKAARQKATRKHRRAGRPSRE